MTTKPPKDLTRVRPGSDPSRLIDALYRVGRSYPREQPAKWPARPAVNDAAKEQHQSRPKNDPGNFQSNQAPENHHSPNYDSDTSGWVRGAPNNSKPTGNNETATRLPNFDYGGSWRRADKGNDWHSESDQRHPGEKGLRTKPEPNK